MWDVFIPGPSYEVFDFNKNNEYDGKDNKKLKKEVNYGEFLTINVLRLRVSILIDRNED
jgi:hypothetical protein